VINTNVEIIVKLFATEVNLTKKNNTIMNISKIISIIITWYHVEV